jgi:hypothetical protein
MSHTVSRGYHKASRWSTPATIILIGLGGSPINTSLHLKGALTAMEQFFNWVLDGIATDNNSMPKGERPPIAAGICALSITLEVVSIIGDSREVTVSVAGQLANRHLLTLKKLREQQTADLHNVLQLHHFLTELIRQGERNSKW